MGSNSSVEDDRVPDLSATEAHIVLSAYQSCSYWLMLSKLNFILVYYSPRAN